MHDENHYMSRCQAPKKLKHLDCCHRTITCAKVEPPEDYHLVNSEKGKTGLILFSAFVFQNGDLGPVGAMVSLQQPSLHKEYKTWKEAVRSSAGPIPLFLEARDQKDEDNHRRPLWPIQDLSPQHPHFWSLRTARPRPSSTLGSIRDG